jgi:hypothetical protein
MPSITNIRDIDMSSERMSYFVTTVEVRNIPIDEVNAQTRAYISYMIDYFRTENGIQIEVWRNKIL